MLDLTPIKERLKAATPGLYWHSPEAVIVDDVGERVLHFNTGVWTHEAEEALGGFIEHSSTDIAALIEENEKLRALAKKLAQTGYGLAYDLREHSIGSRHPVTDRADLAMFDRAHKAYVDYES